MLATKMCSISCSGCYGLNDTSPCLTGVCWVSCSSAVFSPSRQNNRKWCWPTECWKTSRILPHTVKVPSASSGSRVTLYTFCRQPDCWPSSEVQRWCEHLDTVPLVTSTSLLRMLSGSDPETCTEQKLRCTESKANGSGGSTVPCGAPVSLRTMSGRRASQFGSKIILWYLYNHTVISLVDIEITAIYCDWKHIAFIARSKHQIWYFS